MSVSKKEIEAVTIAIEGAVEDLAKYKSLMMKLLVLGPSSTLDSGAAPRDVAHVLRNSVLVAMGMVTLSEAEAVKDGEAVLEAALAAGEEGEEA